MKFLFGIFLLLSVARVSAQELVFPELEGFRKSTNYPVFTSDNLWDFIDGAADTYLSLGFIDLNVAEYKKGKNVIKLEIYRHSDNTMAFGIYSSERSPSYRFINLGAQGYSADGAVNFFKGRYYVKIRTFSKSEKILHSAESLALKVSDMLPGETSMPAMLSKFPETGKKKNEETFINENVLGHKFLSKAFRTGYESVTDTFSIFIIQTASAEETLKTTGAYLKATGSEPAESETGKYVLSDGYNGTIFLAWKERIIVLISGLSKDQAAVADQYSSEILE